MYDQFNRHITYLRISVTDRCNLRCIYCMPAEGVALLRHQDILSFDEIVDFTRTAVKMGVSKVRITGVKSSRAVDPFTRSQSEIRLLSIGRR